MATQVFMAFIAFSLGLLAFCAGAWLTIWATSTNSQCTEVTAAKLSGYFISVLAVIALVFTSYYTARIVFKGKGAAYSKIASWKGKKNPGLTKKSTTYKGVNPQNR